MALPFFFKRLSEKKNAKFRIVENLNFAFLVVTR